MKNSHGVPPTRYMKKKESRETILCDSEYGPIFGHCYNIHYYYNSELDICIRDRCDMKEGCYINNDGNHTYECHPKYKSSLYTNKSNGFYRCRFSILDYEVFGIDYENRDNINKLCKHPDIIWKCIKTRVISVESLKQFDDDAEILTDLDAIHLDSYSNIRMKISKYYFKNPSKLLVNTQIVNEQYDAKLREWCGDFQWRLLYRASEHGYTAESFHEYCDNKRPTLVVIKSSGGWLFGGYTTRSWSGWSIYNDMI